MQDEHQVSISAQHTVSHLHRLLKCLGSDVAALNELLEIGDFGELRPGYFRDQLVLLRSDVDLAHEAVTRWQTLNEVSHAR